MRALRWLLLCVLLLGPIGCRKEGEHSKAYAEATEEFNALYGRHVEDAYLMPEMAPIEQKLESVPESSADYARARELLKRIRSGRERVEAEKAAREHAIRDALQPAEGGRFVEEPAPPPAPAGPPDAGAPEHPAVGMDAAEIQKRWGDCFRPGTPLEVVGRGARETLELRDTLYCRQHHPGFDQQVVVIEGGKVLALAPRKDIKTERVEEPGPPQRGATAPAGR
ncbi:MAG: hypothetical protein IRZ16_09640 [Myxococcaceae bacterium]|nr:hypothetical protein [Myxococcaceae bacterium]